VAICVVLCASIWWFTIDDAYITYRYARNVASGEGPVFNAGQRVEGFSSPLWLAVATLAELVILPAAQACKSIALLTVIGLVWKLSRMTKARGGAGQTPLILLAAHGPLIVAVVSGLETAVSAAIIVLLMLSAHFERQTWRAAALWGCLAILARPENAMLVGMHGLYLWFSRRQSRLILLRAAACWLALASVMATARWFYYGQLVPNTALAKLMPDVAAAGAAWHYLATWSVRYGWLGLFILLAMIPARTRPITAHAILLIVGQIAFLFIAGGDWMPQWRFMLPVSVLLLTLGCLAIPQFAPPVRGKVTRAGLILACAIGIALQLAHFRADRWWLNDYRRQLAALEAGPIRYLSEHAKQDDLVAGRDVGLLGYQMPCRVLDLVGLTDRHIAKTSGLRLRHRLDVDYVFEQKPRFVLLQSEKPATGPPAYDRLSRVLIRQAGFADYTLQSRFDMPAKHFCEVYKRTPPEPAPRQTALTTTED